MEKKCSTCKKGLSKFHITMISISVYMLFASVIGTIQIFKSILSLFY